MLPFAPYKKRLVVVDDRPSSKPAKQKSLTAKDRFNSRFPHLNLEYYTDLTKNILTKCYPKQCPACKIPLTKGVSTRENVLRCATCNSQVSLTKDTPLENLKLPLWTFSYILTEALYRFPLGLSASEIQRRLGVANNTGTLLKRRLQIFLSDLIPSIKEEMVKDIKKAWKGKNLPENGDLRPFIEGKPVVSIDTLALFSASQRANGHRKRFKHKGQTASIYLTDAVAEQRGVYQIGSLVLTQAIKGGPVIFDSIPDQKQKTIQPFFDYLPKNAPMWGDEGFPYLERYNVNFRAVNHSARAIDTKRNVWGRNRWSSVEGINNQCAEGIQRTLKYSFLASYSFFKPKHSILYLNEFSALKGLKVYGLDKLISKKDGLLGYVRTTYRIPNKSFRTDQKPINLLRNRKDLLYKLPTPGSRVHWDKSKSRQRIDYKFRKLFEENRFFLLKQAHLDYLEFMETGPKHRKMKERYYNSVSYMLWNHLNMNSSMHLRSYELADSNSQMPLLRIARRWAKLGIAEVTQVKEIKYDKIKYFVKKLIPDLPDLLYTFDREQYNQGDPNIENVEVIVKETQVGAKSKYGFTMKKRRKLFGRKNGEL